MLLIPLFLSIFMLLVDIYIYQGFKVLIGGQSTQAQKWLKIAYWTVTAVGLALVWISASNLRGNGGLTVFTRSFIMVQYVSKFLGLIFMVLDDLIRFFRWVASFFYKPAQQIIEQNDGVPRSEFLMTAGIIAAGGILSGLTFGIASGAHDYRIRRKTLYLKNLPKSFDGMRLVQLSDIHTGSFWNRTAVQGGVEMAMAEKPDMIVFTGDLVNDVASEMKDYTSVFDKVQAPLGVYSILGNHDYGDYIPWQSKEAKQKNLENLKEAHAAMNWKLLLNENTDIMVNNEKLRLIGVENWSNRGRFHCYGDLAKASLAPEASDCKILLSHDPSHWRAEVLKEYSDIALMLAGHTHGMQFGLELGNFKWSPVQYMYPEWAGLYSEGDQHLYVNRGYGYIGYPGRLGIAPEITVFELKRLVG